MNNICQHRRKSNTALKCIPYTRITWRKRAVLSHVAEVPAFSSSFNNTPIQKRRGRRPRLEMLNRLESLPPDILVRILSGVNHSDLKQLIFVSKAIRDAALIAKASHFAFSTPLSKPVFKSNSDMVDVNELNDTREAPNAPKQKKGPRSRIDGDMLASIVVALFAGADEISH